MATTVLRSPRLETAGPDSPLLRSSSPRVSSPADDTFLSQRYDEEAGTRPSITSKEWKEESCLLMGATDELVDTPLSSSTRRQVAAVGLTMVSVMQVVASKAVLNCISSQSCSLSLARRSLTLQPQFLAASSSECCLSRSPCYGCGLWWVAARYQSYLSARLRAL